LFFGFFGADDIADVVAKKHVAVLGNKKTASVGGLGFHRYCVVAKNTKSPQVSGWWLFSLFC
jgi:hypothetical protein